MRRNLYYQVAVKDEVKRKRANIEKSKMEALAILYDSHSPFPFSLHGVQKTAPRNRASASYWNRILV